MRKKVLVVCYMHGLLNPAALITQFPLEVADFICAVHESVLDV